MDIYINKDSKYNNQIKVDKYSNQKCCLLNYAVLKIELNSINIFGLIDKEIDNIDLSAKHDNKIKIKNENLNIKQLNELYGSKIYKGIWVLIGHYVDYNAGHVLGDEVFAIWQALCSLGIENHANKIHIITTNRGPHIKQYYCLNKNKIKYLDDFKEENACFETLIFGMGRNGYALGNTDLKTGKRNLEIRASYLPDLKKTLNLFRMHCYHINNIEIINKPNNILVLEKGNNSEHSCKLYEIDNIVSKLKKKYNSFNIKKINWSSMNIEEQILLMANTFIVISLPGSDLMNCIFMNPESYIISPNRFYINSFDTKEDSHEIDIWFKYIHNCIEIPDVVPIFENNRLYSKMIDTDLIFKCIDNII